MSDTEFHSLVWDNTAEMVSFAREEEDGSTVLFEGASVELAPNAMGKVCGVQMVYDPDRFERFTNLVIPWDKRVESLEERIALLEKGVADQATQIGNLKRTIWSLGGNNVESPYTLE